MESRFLNKTIDLAYEIRFTKEELDELDCDLSNLDGDNCPVVYNNLPVGIITNILEVDDETVEVSFLIWTKFCTVIPKDAKLTFYKNYEDYYVADALYIE